MATLISTIEEALQISNWGCTVVLAMPEKPPERTVRVGDLVTLRRPDGTELETVVRGIPMGNRNPSVFGAVVLGENVTKEMVPTGTEFWLRETTNPAI